MVLVATLNNKTTNKILVNFKFYNRVIFFYKCSSRKEHFLFSYFFHIYKKINFFSLFIFFISLAYYIMKIHRNFSISISYSCENCKNMDVRTRNSNIVLVLMDAIVGWMLIECLSIDSVIIL